MRAKYIKWFIFTGSLLLILIVSFLVSLTSGIMDIDITEIPSILSEQGGMEAVIIKEIRLPRIILGFSVGGALSLAGCILQGIYRNPLVEPYTLGISGGAALGVALAIVLNLNTILGSYMLPFAGFSGSLVTIFLVYSLGMRKGKTSINSMLLIGVMISFIASSSMMFLMSLTTSENLHSIIFWIMGSLDEPNSMLLNITLYAAFAGLIISMLFARPLNALSMGEEKAMHLGINSVITIRILFILASLLTGICVSVAGVIGFVGLVIPHLIRLFVGHDFRILLPGAFLGGGTFLIICDIISRTVVAPSELPIGVITGMVGGLTFIIVLSNSYMKSKLK